MKNNLGAALIICLGTCFALMFVSFSAPASSWAVDLFGQRPLFFLAVMAPPVAFFLVLLVRWLSAQDPEKVIFPAPVVLLSVLLSWLLYVVLFTGGIYESPLVPVCGMVPLMGGRFFGADTRRRVLRWYFWGVAAVGVASLHSYIAPPASYPTKMFWDIKEYWQFMRFVDVNVVITTCLMIIAIAMELALERMGSQGSSVGAQAGQTSSQSPSP